MKSWSLLCLWMGMLGSAPLAAHSVWSDDRSSVQLNGSWQYDLARVRDGQSPPDFSGFHRRSRLALVLARKQGPELALEYDFTAEEWTEVALRLPLAGGRLLLGQFKQPFGLEELVSDRRTLLPEASLAGGFVLGRRLGVGYLRGVDSSGWQLGAFEHNLNGVSSSSGVAARGWWSAVSAAGQVRHLGLALSHEWPDADRVSLSARPPSRLHDLRVARTGSLDDARRMQRAALELLAVHGSGHLQAEWLLSRVERPLRPDFLGHGGYVQLGWLSGGAVRGYKEGLLQAPDRGSVLELGLRLATVDLHDGAVAGGRAWSLEAASSWYFKPEVRAMLAFSRTDLRDGGQRDDVQVLELRWQYLF